MHPISVRNETTVEKAQLANLRTAYEEAFRQWSSANRLLRALVPEPLPDSTAAQDAQRRIDEDVAAYRNSRNLLTEFMSARNSRAQALSTSVATELTEDSAQEGAHSRNHSDQRSQVEHQAYRLWEWAGRPNGSADSDWCRAEQMILDSL